MADPPPTARATTAQHALEGLRTALVDGRLRPGERIRQEELADRLGTSLAPVREALSALEQEGQLTYRPRRGYFVAELNRDDLEQIYDLRTLLEERAVTAALPILAGETLELMELAARDVADAAESNEVSAELAANRRFHFILFEAAEQRHLTRLIRTLWDATETYRALYYNSPVARIDAIRAHDRILEAVRTRDAGALIAELAEHRRVALDRLREILA